MRDKEKGYFVKKLPYIFRKYGIKKKSQRKERKTILQIYLGNLRKVFDGTNDIMNVVQNLGLMN